MINVVYLVLVLTYSNGITSVTIPQANLKQCEINAKYMKSQRRVDDAYCITGVK